MRARATLALASTALILAPRAGAAQLRPLEPLEWGVFDDERSLVSWLGVGLHAEQRASMAGTTGRLLELGNYMMAWRTGRVALEASGTAYRKFRDDGTYFVPAPGTEPSEGPGTIREDAGDLRLLTALRLTPLDSRLVAALRFGARLPTTNNKKGLDRDQTDFLATIGARGRKGNVSLSVEGGIGLMGTRDPSYEQADMWQYATQLAWDGGRVIPSLSWVGQQSGADFDVQGVESLSELRLGVQLGRERWLRAALVHGVAAASPEWGGLLSMGVHY